MYPAREGSALDSSAVINAIGRDHVKVKSRSSEMTAAGPAAEIASSSPKGPPDTEKYAIVATEMKLRLARPPPPYSSRLWAAGWRREACSEGGSSSSLHARPSSSIRRLRRHAARERSGSHRSKVL
ncbi:MAG: hypothetical protein SGPRY_004448, partial [Prymnesium sp.]